jgi:tetratricopeptide (TPR) repeat protein
MFDSGSDLSEWNEILEGLPERARAIGDESSAALAIILRVELRTITEPGYPVAAGIAEIEALLPALHNVGDDAVIAEALGQLSNLRLWSGDGAGALEASSAAIAAGRRSGQTRSLSVAIDQTRPALLWGPMPSGKALARALDIHGEGGGRGLMMPLLEEAIAVLFALRREFERAYDWLERGRTTVDDLGLTDTGHMAAEVGLLAGRYEEVEGNMRNEFEQQRSLGLHAYLTSTLAYLGSALAGKGDVEEALETTRLAEQYAEPDDVNGQAGWSALRASILAMLGRDLEEAERLARRAGEIAGGTDNLWQRGDTSFILAQVLRARGRPDKADLELHEALRLYEAKENLVMAERVRSQLATS